MEWIKKNWKAIAIVAIVIAVIIYLVNKKRKEQGKTPLRLPAIPGIGNKTATTTVPVQEQKSLADLQKELTDCENFMKTARLASGGVHPCANLRDQVVKAGGTLSTSESNFAGALTKTDGLNVMDYAMGSQGLSLFEDKNMKQGESNYQTTKPKMCRYPDGTPVPCSEMQMAKRSGTLMM